MKIVVISLRSAAERRENISKQFERLGLPFEFFDAVEGRRTTGLVHHYDEKEFLLNTGRAASKNEIGCYVSHFAVWRQCAAGGEPVLILEDDARLSVQFAEGFREIDRVIHNRGFVRAGTPSIEDSVEVQKLGNFRLHYCRRVPLMALAYALSPETAADLVANGSIIEEPVDKFIQRFWRHGRAVFAIRPYVAHLDSLSEQSTIGDRIREDYPMSLRCRRAVRKCENAVLRELFNIQCIFALQHERFQNRRATAPQLPRPT